MHNENHKHHSHNTPIHKDMATLSKKLQSEIDHILSHVDERTLFAEFRENEIFDIQNGDKKEVVRYTLDERIIMNRQSPRTASMAARLERTTTNAAEKITGMRRMVNYLFKPLQY